MRRFAIFVDAGYFLAEGSKSLTGQKVRRRDLSLEGEKAVQILKDVAHKHLPNKELLRIYWYDGALGRTLSNEQSAIASLNDVKLRLGIINQFGQQKGVDSLIVADLIELARLNSISDALLLSGDEDVRVGVQIAQNHGVRVHLLGIKPNQQSRSEQLLHEADTISLFLTKNQIQKILHHTPVKEDKLILDAVKSFVDGLTSQEKEQALEHWNAGHHGAPRFLDRRLLAHCRDFLERLLEPGEIKYMRSCFGKILTGDSGA
ncbi:MAG: NYN domain-containing protein [Hyphomicrobiales bacterium]|nr:NYN domain-containing protein [Hyphomicrobiales bacterium]